MLIQRVLDACCCYQKHLCFFWITDHTSGSTEAHRNRHKNCLSTSRGVQSIFDDEQRFSSMADEVFLIVCTRDIHPLKLLLLLLGGTRIDWVESKHDDFTDQGV